MYATAGRRRHTRDGGTPPPHPRRRDAVVTLISEVADMESVGTADGKFLIAPRLIPSGVAAQAVFRIVDTVFKSIHGRFQSTAGFEVDAADFNGARAFFVAKKLRRGGGDDAFVMLCGDVVYDGQMG